MHLHLDLTGGIAGDMFSAALLDAFPALEAPLQQALETAAQDIHFRVRVVADMNKGISGKRFIVDLAETPSVPHLALAVQHQKSHPHQHWQQIRAYIGQCSLPEIVKHHALGIFGLLAQAEAEIHHVDVEQVYFHEVGAWDCIADILSAAWLIAHCGATSWSVSRLPWGGGSVKCAHGVIPVPAPATLKLLTGYAFIDDGEAGERITPTGAAILAWLAPAQRITPGQLQATGYGLGSRKLLQRPNILRVTVLAPAPAQPYRHEHITVIQCDIDDMSGELLAIAREQLRAMDDVLEVTESTAHGKKNRFISTLTLLCYPQHRETVITAVFEQTSTLGLRYWQCERLSLARQHQQLDEYHVKTAQRPDGRRSAKLEADDLVACSTYQQRLALKRKIEQQAEEQANEPYAQD